jgi:hypothetical protein
VDEKITRQAMCVCSNSELSHNLCCISVAVSITYSECVFVVLVLQHAMRMLLFILPSVRCLAVPLFFTLSYKQHDFQENVSSMKFVLCFVLHILSEIFLILRRIEWDININIDWSSCKVRVILVRF